MAELERSKIRVNKKCSRCGLMMKNVHPQRKYCPECAKDVQREISKQFNQEKRKTKIRKQSTTDIVEINKRARQEGLTYGQYVAKYLNH